jgi:hypothetical protein
VAAGGAVADTTTTERRRPSSFGVLAGSLAAFFALLAFLAVQVRAGGDPALGPAKAPAERRVIVHRVVVRRAIITDPAPVSGPSGPGRGGGGSSPPAAATLSATAPPAPAPSAPAPAAAPLTTGSS